MFIAKAATPRGQARGRDYRLRQRAPRKASAEAENNDDEVAKKALKIYKQ